MGPHATAALAYAMSWPRAVPFRIRSNCGGLGKGGSSALVLESPFFFRGVVKVGMGYLCSVQPETWVAERPETWVATRSRWRHESKFKVCEIHVPEELGTEPDLVATFRDFEGPDHLLVQRRRDEDLLFHE